MRMIHHTEHCLDLAYVRSLAAKCAGEAGMEQLRTEWNAIAEQTPTTATMQHKTDGCVILTGQDAEWWAVGVIYAALTGRMFCHESEAVTHPAEELLFLGPREEFQFGRVQELFTKLQPDAEHLQGHVEGQTAVFAILTASSLDVMIRMMRDTLRNMLDQAEKAPLKITHLLTLEDRELLQQPHPQIQVFNRKTAKVSQLLESPHDVLTVMSHGTDEMLYIGSEESICGYAGEIEQMRENLLLHPEQETKNYPVCVYQGHCTRPGERVRADQVDARIVLLNTCLGIRMTDATFPEEFSVGLNFLNGHATHLVAVDQIKEGDAAEGAFFTQLLRSGMPIGEAVRRLNNLLWAADLNAPGYLLIGDPAVCVSDQVLTPRRITPDVEGRFNAELTGEVPILHLRLESSQLYDFCVTRKLSVHIHAPEQQELFTVLLPDHEKRCADLYLFSFGELAVGTYECEIQTWDHSLGYRVERALAQYHLLSPRKILPDSIKGAVKEIKAKSIQIARTRKASHLRVADAKLLASQMKSLHDQLDRVDVQLAKWHREMIIKQAFQMFDAYFDQWELVQQRTGDDQCPISGHRLSERVMRHPLVSSSFLYSAICPKCGDIQDGPDHRIRLYMEGESQFRTGETIRQALIVENRSAETVRGSAGIAIWDKGFDLDTSPAVTSVELAPGASVRIEFALTYDPERIQAHLHYLRAVFVSDLCVYRAHKNIHLTR